MSSAPVTVALGLVAALAVNPTVWTAKLEGKDGSKITGTARVEAIAATYTPRDSAMPPRDSTKPMHDSEKSKDTYHKAGTGNLRVTVTVSNAPQNSTLLWSVRKGECGEGGEDVKVIGSATGNITIDAQGNGTATSEVKATLPADEDVHLAVYGRQEAGKLAACGKLEAAKTSTEN